MTPSRPSADGTASRTPLATDSKPSYEPPRLVKKRSVSRATLFTGGGGPSAGGPSAQGIVAEGNS